MARTIASIWLMLCGLAIVIGIILLGVFDPVARWIEIGIVVVATTVWSMHKLGWFDQW